MDAARPEAYDITKRFVRLIQVRDDGFIEFAFAIGDPDLSVDLILPAAAYHEFCRHNQVTLIAPLHEAGPEPE